MPKERLAGCSKWPSSKAAGEPKPEAYLLGYVEDFDELRTKLATIFNILLKLNLSPECPMRNDLISYDQTEADEKPPEPDLHPIGAAVALVTVKL